MAPKKENEGTPTSIYSPHDQSFYAISYQIANWQMKAPELEHRLAQTLRNI